jgi:hypothetical protein
MKRIYHSILHDLYPDKFHGPECSPEQKARQVQRGRDLARHRPWAAGRIGRIEKRVHFELIGAAIRSPGRAVSTGQLVRAIYCDKRWDQRVRLRDKDVEPPRPQHWMYERVRLAAAIYADPVGRGRGGTYWRLRKDTYASTIRAQKRERYRRNRPA